MSHKIFAGFIIIFSNELKKVTYFHPQVAILLIENGVNLILDRLKAPAVHGFNLAAADVC